MRAWETSWQVQNSPRPAPAPTNPPVRCPGPAVPPLFHGFFSAVGARLETTHPAGCPHNTLLLLLLLPRPPGAAGGVGAAAMANPLVQRCGARPRAPPAPHLPFPSGPGQAPDRPKPHLPAPGRPAGPPAAAEGARPREARPAPALRPSGRPPPAQQPPPGRTPGPGPPARAGSAPPRLAEASSSARLSSASALLRCVWRGSLTPASGGPNPPTTLSEAELHSGKCHPNAAERGGAALRQVPP